jgi:hypothetical protein
VTAPTAAVDCPYCWESIELIVDPSAGSARYTEDCPVCCQPIAVTLTVGDDGDDFSVEVEAENS